jgi:hypothetical protein
MIGIEVSRKSADGLREELWQFSASTSYYGGSDTVTLMLSYYAKRERPSTRHKMKVGASNSQWSRMEQRSYFSGLKADEVPLPEDVKADAIAKIRFDVVGAQP